MALPFIQVFWISSSGSVLQYDFFDIMTTVDGCFKGDEDLTSSALAIESWMLKSGPSCI